MRDTLLLIVVGGFVPFSVIRPVMGILFFTWLAFFYPQSHAWGIATRIPLSEISAAATIFGCLVSRDVLRFPMQRETFLLLALWGFFGVSSVFAIYPDRAAANLIEVSKIFLMVMLTTMLLRDSNHLRALVRVVALSLGFYGLKGGVFAVITGGQQLVYGPQGSFLAANNSIGLALAMNVPLLYFLFRTETRRWLRCVIAAMLLFSYPAVICTYSRGAWLGLAMATALLFLRSRHKFLIVAIVGLFGVVGISARPQLMPERLSFRYNQLVNYERDDSAESRFWNWEFCKRVGMDRPLTGGGFRFTSLENYEKYYPEFLQRWPGKEWTCHSVWFTIFGEHGFPGFLLWLVLLVSCLFSLRSMRARAKANPELAWMALYADSLQAGLVVYLVVGTFLDAAYFDVLYYWIAMIIIGKSILLDATRAAVAPGTVPVAQAPVLARPRIAMTR